MIKIFQLNLNVLLQYLVKLENYIIAADFSSSIFAYETSEFILPVLWPSNSDGQQLLNLTRMWANAQRDGRRVEYRWRPLFKFG